MSNYSPKGFSTNSGDDLDLDKLVPTPDSSAMPTAGVAPLDFELSEDDLMGDSDFPAAPAPARDADNRDAYNKDRETGQIIGLGANSDLDRFVEGFSGLSNNYRALDAIVSDIKSQTRAMREYSQSLKKEAAKNAALANQVKDYQADISELRRIAETQSNSIEDLEAELAKKTATLSIITSEFRKSNTDLEDLKARYDDVISEKSTLSLAHDQLSAQLAERKSAYERSVAEVENLREIKEEILSDLRSARQEASNAKSQLADLEAKYEKISSFQETLIADRGRSTEERRQLRRQIAAVETQLAEYKIKAERLELTNTELVGRLESEKFSMTKNYEAVASDYKIAKQRLASFSSEVDTLRGKLETERAERANITQTMKSNASALEESRRELSRANLAISEMNLKYSADSLTLDQLREENVELRNRIEKLQDENTNLHYADTEVKAANMRADRLQERWVENVLATEASAQEEIDVEAAPKDFTTMFNFKSTNYQD